MTSPREIFEYLGLPEEDLPAILPEAQFMANWITTVEDDGKRWTWMPNDVSNPYDPEGKKIPEPLVKYWIYDRQVQLLSSKIAQVKLKTTPYKQEIRQIDLYLVKAKSKNKQNLIKNAHIQVQIDETADRMKKLRDRGTPTTDTDYRLLDIHLNKLQSQLITNTNYRITSWPDEIGGAAKPNQNLTFLKNKYEGFIKDIEKHEIKPLDDEKDLNKYWKSKWKKVCDEWNIAV